MPERPPPPRTTTKPNMPAVPREFQPLPENASHEQLVHAQHEMAAAYATIAAGYTDRLPKLERDHEEFRFIQDGHGIRISKLEVQMEETRLPPMRDELGSSSDLSKHASGEIADKVTAALKDETTPPPDREQVKAISEDVIQIAMARVKEQEEAKRWRELEAERKSAETDRLAIARQAKLDQEALVKENTKAKSNTKWALILAGGLAVVGVAREVIERVFVPKPVPSYVAPAPKP